MYRKRLPHLLVALTLLTALVISGCSGAKSDEPDTQDMPDTSDALVDNGGDTGDTTDTDTTPVGYNGLVINEVAPRGEPDDWFELYNNSMTAIDLAGVTFTDDIAMEPARAVFQAGTTIAAGGYHVVYFDMNGPDFGLGGDEELGLFAPDGTMIDSIDWDDPDSPAGTSLGRIPNGTGDFKTLNTPTPGAENVDNTGPVCGDGMREGMEVCDGMDLGTRTCVDEGFVGGVLACAVGCMGYDTTMCEAPMNDIVINEVTSADDDSIELFNNGMSAQDLSGWYIVDDGYDPGDPMGTADQRYDFPMGTMLDGGAYLVLVKNVDHMFGVGGDDTLTLYDDTDSVVDQEGWPADAALVSWCRFPNGTGEFQNCSRTFGMTNMP